MHDGDLDAKKAELLSQGNEQNITTFTRVPISDLALSSISRNCMGIKVVKRISIILLGLFVWLPLTGADNEKLKLLELEAKQFFKVFSKALEKDDSTEASMHIAPKYRKGFRKGYRFWRGYKLSALKVVGVPDKAGVLRVRTQIMSPAGKKDAEIKKLLRIKDRWFLFER